ncbi:hypothetical protein ZIOFF_050164 [Zingiber officinale]|uniref:Uncharacterized protein n=1 Tax=Zingiber officinale TaxID=94328 RepID=A0A8J5FJZ0_ZINOF|nr:hypothetical protein ZIOFF_050164 [Zingiber officinale]
MAAASDAEKISDKSFSSNDTAFGLGERGPILSRLESACIFPLRSVKSALTAGPEAMGSCRMGSGRVGMLMPLEVYRAAELEAARLTAELAGSGGPVEYCWKSLLELRWCTNEIVLFFLNWESYFSGLASTAAAPSASSPTTAVLPAGLPCSPASASRSRRATSFVSYCNAETAHTPPPRPTPLPSAASMAAVAGAEITGDALMP